VLGPQTGCFVPFFSTRRKDACHAEKTEDASLKSPTLYVSFSFIKAYPRTMGLPWQSHGGPSDVSSNHRQWSALNTPTSPSLAMKSATCLGA
jgi:hypothetical protein